MEFVSVSDRRAQLGVIAVFLLVVVDGITTWTAAMLYGTQSEANPLIRWALEQGLATFIGINVIAAGLCLVAISILVRYLPDTTENWVESMQVQLYTVWVYGLIIFGLLLGINNILFIFNGYGLITLLS